MEFRTVGVVGAGVIGSGVAQLFAQTGHRVVLVDVDPDQLSAARGKIGKNLKLFSLLEETAIDADATLERLHDTTDPADLEDADFVIENVTEDWPLKREVHGEIDAVVGRDTPIAANTSAIPITRIASAGRFPDRVLGMHFMNPVPLMPMVEIIRATHTSEPVLEAAGRLVEQAGRRWIVVEDSPGFVTNRVMMLMVNEAMFLVYEGVAPAQDVDRLFKTCFGHKMGPLETADLIGLDTVLRSLEVLYDELSDSKYRPCPLLRRLVYAGRLGRKSGQGFHDYTATETRPLSDSTTGAPR